MNAPQTDTVFTTLRLRARRWRDSDLASLLEVYGDEDAMRWVGDGSPLTRDEAVRWLQRALDTATPAFAARLRQELAASPHLRLRELVVASQA